MRRSQTWSLSRRGGARGAEAARGKEAATKTMRVTEEQLRLLKELKRSPWEPLHAVLQRVLEHYLRCGERCKGEGAP